jgi:glycine hydroxymethyltransferase
MNRNTMMNTTMKSADAEVFSAIEKEFGRQQDGIELIASENYASRAVMEAQGSVLTNKYAEGYPGKRYYGGCEYVDVVERLAIERVCKIFGGGSTDIAANVQPHSGSQANMAVYMALLKPGDKIVGMSLAEGGHLTHGSPVNFSGKLYQIFPYGLDPKTERIDYDQVRDLVKKEKPKMLIAGASAYSRIIDFETFGAIAKENGCDLCSADRIKAANSQIFPGIQGGPLMHAIAGKAVAFGEALKPEFKEYQMSVISNAKVLADSLTAEGLRLVTGGTDNHLMLADLTSFGDGSVTGKDAEAWLDKAHITVNKNAIPGDQRSPFITSGIRIGTPAASTRGFGGDEMKAIAKWITAVLRSKGDEAALAKIGGDVKALCGKFPVYSASY